MAATSSLSRRIGDDLKAAMRAKDTLQLACLRQIRAKLQEAEHAAAPAGAPAGGEPEADAEVVAVIRAYRKGLQKAVAQMAGAGERSLPLRQKYEAECAFLSRYLPPAMDAEVLASRLAELARELGIHDARGRGRLLGALMQRHGDDLEPAAARRAVDAMFA